eukprot:4566290-Amphidinium_carterae.1
MAAMTIVCGCSGHGQQWITEVLTSLFLTANKGFCFKKVTVDVNDGGCEISEPLKTAGEFLA